MPETATIDLLTNLGKSLYETPAQLAPQVAAELERRGVAAARVFLQRRSTYLTDRPRIEQFHGR